MANLGGLAICKKATDTIPLSRTRRCASAAAAAAAAAAAMNDPGLDEAVESELKQVDVQLRYDDETENDAMRDQAVPMFEFPSLHFPFPVLSGDGVMLIVVQSLVV